VLLSAASQHEVVAADMISWQIATERQKKDAVYVRAACQISEIQDCKCQECGQRRKQTCNNKTSFMCEPPVRIQKCKSKTVSVMGAARGASIGTSESYTKSLLGVSAVLRVDDWFKNANTLF
jgi:hypothetical protein